VKFLKHPFQLLLTAGLLFNFFSSAQMNNYWVMGYGSGIINPSNMVYSIDFRNGQIEYDTVFKHFSFRSNDASICDSAGNLLFYTNGFAVMNANHDTMVNGEDLNPSIVGSSNWDDTGMPYAQMSIIIPVSGANNQFYIIHHCYYIIIQLPHEFCDSLFYSIVDMTQDSGRGAVTAKNQLLWSGDAFNSDIINEGCLTACKHANGRDWWIVSHKDSSNIFMTFLLTPTGFTGPFLQSIGPVINFRSLQACFSPDGSKYAIMVNDRPHVFDFDRCSGQFSNHKNLGPFGFTTYASEGIVFSPNSRFLYASAAFEIYQWDLYATNVNSTKTTVCVYDSVNPCPNYLVYFYLMQAAIDGKIYISSPNSSNCMSVINYPDSAGMACNAVPRGLSTLPFYNGFSVPYYPNFYLGAEIGSLCDSLTGVQDNTSSLLPVTVYPNPGEGIFRINYQLPPGNEGWLEIYNSLGSLVLIGRLSAWSRVHEVDLVSQPPGIYLCRVSSGASSGVVKLVKN
jgi:hypothetical protein